MPVHPKPGAYLFVQVFSTFLNPCLFFICIHFLKGLVLLYPLFMITEEVLPSEEVGTIGWLKQVLLGSLLRPGSPAYTWPPKVKPSMLHEEI